LPSAPSFALDTNALIHALKGAGRVRQRLTALDPGQIAVPAVVAYEVEYGTLKAANPESRRRELKRLLSVVEVLPFNREAADRSAKIRLALEGAGQTIGPLDFLIAGTALAFGCTLVTNNTAEFRRVPGLLLEDWF
jgi:tRNA(fMet)-specific endonuclease VapC